MRYLILASMFVCSLSAQVITNQIARQIYWGPSLPATCSPAIGDIFFKTTSTVGPYWCSATNTWVYWGGAGSGAPGGSQYYLQTNAGSGNFGGITPSATAGVPLLSGGSGANASFGALSLAGGSSFVTGILPVANLPVGTGANNIVELNASAQLPAVSAALLTNFPTLNQSTTGNAATATNLASYPTLCSGGQFSQGLSSGSNNCGTPPGGVSIGGTVTSGTAYAVLYVGSGPVLAQLIGNTAATDQVLVSHGTGSAAQAPTFSNAPALSAANMTSFPTLNQNTTGTAAGLTSYPTLCSGGQFSQGLSSGSNNCATPSGSGNVSGPGSSTSGYLPQWNGTSGTLLSVGLPVSATAAASTVVESGAGGTISAAWIPTLNQNTTGTAASISGGSANDLIYQTGSSTTGFITPVNNAVLITSNTAVPSESTTLPIAVQSNITQLGTIAAGVWNGTAIGAAYLPTATSSVKGIVQGDGATLTITAGVIACTTATTSQIGCAKPDGSSITISGGVLTAVGGAASFSTLNSGTNTTAAMLCGTGCSLGYSGSGTVSANNYGYGLMLTSGNIAVNTAVIPSISAVQQNESFCNSTTGTTSFACTFAYAGGSALTAYTNGMVITLVTNATSISGSTVNIDTLGNVTLKQNDCSTSINTSQVSGQPQQYEYNSASGYFCSLNPIGSGSGLFSSYQFGSQTAITGSGVYLQTTYPSILTATQTGSGTSGSPFIDALTVSNQAGGTVWGNNGSTSAAPSFTSAPVIGVNGTIAGTLGIANGNTSGASVTFQNPSTTSAWNFNMPTSSGSSGYLLSSGGGGSTPMTWTAPSLTINTSSPLAGGGSVALGGSLTINCNTCGGGGGGTTQSSVILPVTVTPLAPLGLAVTSPVTVSNTAVATSLIGGTYLGSSMLHSGYQVGRSYRIRMSGLYGTSGLPTITFTVVLGGVTIGSLAPTLISGASGDGWILDFTFTVASMTAVNGSGCVSDQGSSGAMLGACVGSTTSGLNFGTGQALDVQVTWSIASTSNTITAYNAIVREL